VIISPIQWADRKGQGIADKVERGMVEGAVEEAKEAEKICFASFRFEVKIKKELKRDTLVPLFPEHPPRKVE
jgi:hypothetical protein